MGRVPGSPSPFFDRCVCVAVLLFSGSTFLLPGGTRTRLISPRALVCPLDCKLAFIDASQVVKLFERSNFDRIPLKSLEAGQQFTTASEISIPGGHSTDQTILALYGASLPLGAPNSSEPQCAHAGTVAALRGRFARSPRPPAPGEHAHESSPEAQRFAASPDAVRGQPLRSPGQEVRCRAQAPPAAGVRLQ